MHARSRSAYDNYVKKLLLVIAKVTKGLFALDNLWRARACAGLSSGALALSQFRTIKA